MSEIIQENELNNIIPAECPAINNFLPGKRVQTEKTALRILLMIVVIVALGANS